MLPLQSDSLASPPRPPAARATTPTNARPPPTPQAFIHGRYLYVIGGGCFKPLCEDADVHRLDLDEMEWSAVATRGVAPPACVAHTCAYDPEEGGYRVVSLTYDTSKSTAGSTNYASVCCGAQRVMQWLAVATRGGAPLACIAHTCAYDAEDGV